jgi:dipeptidyl aminopeptidase/acylaminoacyl peptidase
MSFQVDFNCERCMNRFPRYVAATLAALAGACNSDNTTGGTKDPVASVSLNAPADSLGQGDTVRLSATATTASGRVIEHPLIQWSDSKSGIITISATGLVTGLYDGSVTVRATVDGVTGTADVLVKTVLRNVIIYTTEAFGLPEVGVVRPDGSGRRRVTKDQIGYGAPLISPDGRRIAFVSKQTGVFRIYVMNADGTQASLLTQRANGEGAPAWSPDGAQIAFRGDTAGPYGDYGRIYVIHIDGTGLRRVSPDGAPTSYITDEGPTWSPDGTRIAFDRNGQLRIINADGTGLVDLVRPEGGQYPSWSPDGTRIAYEGVSGGTIHIWVRNADGSNPAQITTATQQEDMPRWSPDSHRLVFDRIIDGSTLFTINADGTGEVRLSPIGLNSDGWASWR